TASLEKLEDLIAALKDDPLVTKVDSVLSATNMTADELVFALEIPEMRAQVEPAFDQLTNGERALLQVQLQADGSSEKAKNWVSDWNDKQHDLDIKVGGFSKFQQEIFDEIYDKIGYSLAFILISTYIVLFFAFK